MELILYSLTTYKLISYESATTSRAGDMKKAPGRGQALLVFADLSFRT
jgi:hypothetical protein